MIAALLLLMTTAVTFCTALRGLGLLADINLYGTTIKEFDLTILHFNCTTNQKTLGCSVEFHVNDVTYDDIRFVNDKCVHNNGRCQSNICGCTDNCMSFTLNISTTATNATSTFGCEARILVPDAKTTYSVRTSVEQKGEDFRLFEKVIVPVSGENNSPNLTPECKSFSRTPLIVLAVLISALLAAGIIFIVLRKMDRITKLQRRFREDKGKSKKTISSDAENSNGFNQRYRWKSKKTIPIDAENAYGFNEMYRSGFCLSKKRFAESPELDKTTAKQRTKGRFAKKSKAYNQRQKRSTKIPNAYSVSDLDISTKGLPYSAISIIGSSSTEESTLPNTRDESSTST